MIAKVTVTNPRVSAYGGAAKVPVIHEKLLKQTSEEEDSEDSAQASVDQIEKAESVEEGPETESAAPEGRNGDGAKEESAVIESSVEAQKNN